MKKNLSFIHTVEQQEPLSDAYRALKDHDSKLLEEVIRIELCMPEHRWAIVETLRRSVP